jgi:hypothetical protein
MLASSVLVVAEAVETQVLASEVVAVEQVDFLLEQYQFLETKNFQWLLVLEVHLVMEVCLELQVPQAEHHMLVFQILYM